MTSSALFPDRLMLWADGVGSFLICLRDEVTLGQPAAVGGPDVPIMGDLSRRHAVVRREGEAYTIEAVRSASVGGREVRGTAPLWDGSTIELRSESGSAVQFRFTRPHPLSASARLELLSRNRTQPSTDGVLLMADSCILGPSPTGHVVAPEWPHEVILFRQTGGLACRTAAKIAVDGATQAGRAMLSANSRVEGESFAFALEPL